MMGGGFGGRPLLPPGVAPPDATVVEPPAGGVG